MKAVQETDLVKLLCHVKVQLVTRPDRRGWERRETCIIFSMCAEFDNELAEIPQICFGKLFPPMSSWHGLDFILNPYLTKLFHMLLFHCSSIFPFKQARTHDVFTKCSLVHWLYWWYKGWNHPTHIGHFRPVFLNLDNLKKCGERGEDGGKEFAFCEIAILCFVQIFCWNRKLESNELLCVWSFCPTSTL